MSNHPPMANRLIMVDFDGTIVPWGPLMERRPPYPGVAEAMQKLRAAGYRLGIFTSRLSPAWIENAKTTRAEQMNYIKSLLDAFNIPFDFMTAEKLPAEAYFDDKAWHVGEGDLAETIATWRIFNAT